METRDIKRQIRNVFDPLAQKFGLLGFCESNLSNTGFSIAYFCCEMGLELNVDLSDFFIYALLYKPSGQEIPVGYEDASGNRQKIYLQEALKELAIDVGKAKRRLQQLGGDYQNCSEMLTILQRLVEENWHQLISERHRWFGQS
jgi:hypothetical protein